MILEQDGEIYEGLVTNFFAVVEEPDGSLCVLTAPNDCVLEGTIGAFVETVCSNLKINFRFERPKAPFHHWIGCFLTSNFFH